MGMKTTMDLSDNLLRRAKVLARKQKITLKALTEEGLALVLDARERRKPRKVKPVAFGGKGLALEFREAPWSEIRKAIYAGRGE
jgi:predicted transcriptional regulator